MYVAPYKCGSEDANALLGALFKEGGHAQDMQSESQTVKCIVKRDVPISQAKTES